MDSVEKYLLGLIQGIVQHPHAVKISYAADNMGVLFTVSVHSDDAGKVIGSNGDTAMSIRRLVRVAGFNTGSSNRIAASVKFDIPERH